MLRRILLLLSLLLLACGSRPVACSRPASVLPALRPLPERIASQEASVLAMLEDDSLHEVCGATWVKADRLLTAAHCVRGAGPLVLVKSGSEELLSAVERVDEGKDLALLKVAAAPAHEVASFGPEPAVGDRLAAQGPMLGMHGVYMEGIVSKPHVTYNDGDINMLLEMPVLPGMSGSGVFDQKGRLVGVVLRMTPGFAWVSQIDIIREFLSAAPAQDAGVD